MRRAAGYALFAVLVAGACTSYDAADSPPTDPGDGGNAGDSGSGGDAATADGGDGGAARCNRDAPFAAPRKLLGLRDPGTVFDDYAAFLTRDGALYFTSNRGGGNPRVFAARKTGPETFADVAPLPAVINEADSGQGAPFLADDLTLYFVRGALFYNRLFVATRTAPAAGWETASPLADVGFGDRDTPYVSQDRETLYHTSFTPSLNRFAIYRERRSSDGSYTDPTIVTELTSDAGVIDMRATLTDDELRIYFTSDRTGTSRIWTATRPTKAGTFSNIARVDELVVGVASANGHISGDGCTLVFQVTNPKDGGGEFSELWIADKP